MALLERDIMNGTSFGEPITTQNPPSEEYLAERKQVWKDTSLPGDIFNLATGEIKRNRGDKVALPYDKVVTNINVEAARLVEERMALTGPTFEPAPRRRLSLVKQVTASLLTSLVR